MGNTITFEGFGSLYDDILDGLKIEWLNERITNLDKIYVTSIVNIISFIIFVLSLKKLVNLSAKIQSLEKPNKIDHRDIQNQRNLMEHQFQCCIIRE